MYVSIWFETKRAPKFIYKSKHFEKENLPDALKYTSEHGWEIKAKGNFGIVCSSNKKDVFCGNISITDVLSNCYTYSETLIEVNFSLRFR